MGNVDPTAFQVRYKLVQIKSLHVGIYHRRRAGHSIVIAVTTQGQ